jgi:hypothetical protein
MALDRYIHQRLWCNDPETAVLGYLGVIYWGHYSGADTTKLRPKRALSRAHLALHGIRRSNLRSIRRIGVRRAADVLTEARELAYSGELARAIAALLQLPQLGMAFASKVCTFMAPDRCAVIDSIIVDRHRHFGFTLRGDYVANTKSNIARYERYCRHLQERAELANAQGQKWTDRDGKQYSWRAVDIERAMYHG